MKKYWKTAMALVTVCVMLCSMCGIVSTAYAENAVYIIDPSATDGQPATLGAVSGTGYSSYAAFEAAYSGTDTVDVYFAAGEFDGITVNRNIRLYGAKAGIDPNARSTDKLQQWTLVSDRGSGETVFTSPVTVSSSATGGVIIDGVTMDRDAKINVQNYASDCEVVLQNIVVGANIVADDYFLNASPTVNIVPGKGNYPMRFTLKNVYAGNYAGDGTYFLWFISAKEVNLQSIYLSNCATVFIETSAASTAGNTFVMDDCFLYNVIPVGYGMQAPIYHRFPSGLVENVCFTDNVFYNAYGLPTSGTPNNITIALPEIKSDNHYCTLTGNTFVSTAGTKAAVRNVVNNYLTTAFDLSKFTITRNRFIGYMYALNSWDGNNKTYTGSIDMTDNFGYYVENIGDTTDITGEADCRALTGVKQKAVVQAATVNTNVPYFLDYDMTKSSDDVKTFIIDPTATDGQRTTVGTVSAKKYSSYAAFESAYIGTAKADVYFVAGEFDGITVNKSINLYGAKAGIDPNVRNTDKLKEWTLSPDRGSGETVFTSPVTIAATATGGVTIDGVTMDRDAKVDVKNYASNCEVVLQNIVVGANIVANNYFLNASPTVNVVPGAGNYPMRFTLKNVYAGNYQGTGTYFLWFISAKKVNLEGIYFSNNQTVFIETSAASTVGNDFVMKDCFLYNNMPTALGVQATIYHRFPSLSMNESVSFIDNVFYNAFGMPASGTPNNVTIFLPEIKNLTQYYTFTGNTFVSTRGSKAVVRTVSAGAIDNFDLGNFTVTGNRFVGYMYALNSWDGNNRKYKGSIDMTDNFGYYVANIGDTTDITSEDDCRALTGAKQKATVQAAAVNTNVPYFLDYDMTVSSDMCRVTGIDLDGAIVDTAGGVIRATLPASGSYVPTLTYACGTGTRTVVLKQQDGTVIDSITGEGIYQMVVSYNDQSRTYQLILAQCVPYDGDGYLFDPAVSGTTVSRYWDGKAYDFTVGVNAFATLSALFAKSDADGVAVPTVLMPAGEYADNQTITHSCNILGAKHGIDPVVKVAGETVPNTLSTERGNAETVIKGKYIFKYSANGQHFTVDGVETAGDGRFADTANDFTGAEVTYKNIYLAPSKFTSAAATSIRFDNGSNTEKTLTYENIFMDGAKIDATLDGKQLFNIHATHTLMKNVYIANTDLSVCSNVFFESGKNSTEDLSLTVQNCKWYECTPNSACSAFLTIYYGSAGHAYYDYTNRQSVAILFKDNVFYNCALASGNNPYNNALLQMRYPAPCFTYEFDGNTMIDTRASYAYIAGNPPTNVYGQFLHFAPFNNEKSGAVYGIDLSQKIRLHHNRFIGKQTVINGGESYCSALPYAEDNYVLSQPALAAIGVANLSGAVGENPYAAINTTAYRPGDWYVDYAMTVKASDLAPAVGTVDMANAVVTLQKSGTLTASEFAPSGTTAALFTDAALQNAVTSLDTATLKAGTTVLYLTISENGVSVLYTVLLHTVTSETAYDGAVLYAPSVKGVANGFDYYEKLGGKVYHFVTGQTVFGSMDDIVSFTQKTAPTVLLAAGTYTAEELSVVTDVNYLYDEGAIYDDAAATKADKIKVACIGDSVTLGTGATDRKTKAYPAVLQQLLGDDYIVTNYGRGGSLGSSCSQFGYTSQYNYNLSLVGDADVIILEFGANDTQDGYNGVPLEYYKEDMTALIRTYQALPSHPIIYLAGLQRIRSGWNTDWIAQMCELQEETAKDAGIGFIDEFALGAAWDDNSYFNDNCHPNNAGYEKLAADYYNTIDWTEVGAHLPTEDAEITFTALPKTEIPDVFDITLSAAQVEADAAREGRYKIGWQLNVGINTESEYLESDINVLSYGIYCAAQEQTLLQIENDITPTAKYIQNVFRDNGGQPLDRVYKTTEYSLTGVAESRTRFAVCYITYEVDGETYTQYTAIDRAETVAPGIVEPQDGGIVIGEDTLED